MVGLWVYTLGGIGLLKYVAPDYKTLVAEQNRLEGKFKFEHARGMCAHVCVLGVVACHPQSPLYLLPTFKWACIDGEFCGTESIAGGLCLAASSIGARKSLPLRSAHSFNYSLHSLHFM